MLFTRTGTKESEKEKKRNNELCGELDALTTHTFFFLSFFFHSQNVVRLVDEVPRLHI